MQVYLAPASRFIQRTLLSQIERSDKPVMLLNAAWGLVAASSRYSESTFVTEYPEHPSAQIVATSITLPDDLSSLQCKDDKIIIHNDVQAICTELWETAESRDARPFDRLHQNEIPHETFGITSTHATIPQTFGPSSSCSGCSIKQP